MKIYLHGHDFEFATQQIYMCMFPNSHAEFVSEIPADEEYIISSLHKTELSVISKTEIYRENKCVSFTESEVSVSLDFDEEDNKRACRRAIKTSFFKAACQLFEKVPVWGALTGIRPSKVAASYIADGLDAKEAEKRMCEDYFVSPGRAALAVRCASHAKKISDSVSRRDFSLYVAIPFCASRCRYCSFVSHSIEKAKNLIEPYLAMLEEELKLLSASVKQNNLTLRSVYIGGGTPTSLENRHLEFVMGKIRECFDLSDVLEYTVEAGRPDTLNEEKIKTVERLGGTRISVNPQTMNDEILRDMDRRHTAEDVVRIVRCVRENTDLDINMDLIAGLPGDNFESFKNSIDRVIALDPENITVHTLAIKKGSELHNERYKLPAGDETEQMVDYAMQTVCNSGYLPYYLYRQKYMSGNLENVGYAKEGHESLYNNYIMDELHTILSAGAGGVTKLIDTENGRIARIFNPKYPYEYNNAKEKIEATQGEINKFFEE